MPAAYKLAPYEAVAFSLAHWAQSVASWDGANALRADRWLHKLQPRTGDLPLLITASKHVTKLANDDHGTYPYGLCTFCSWQGPVQASASAALTDCLVHIREKEAARAAVR